MQRKRHKEKLYNEVMSEKPLIAVTGASGLLGRPLMSLLDFDSRFQVRGAAFSRAKGGLDKVDLLDESATAAWLDEIKPSALVHLAAERRPDVYAENPEAAESLNIIATESLARLCAEREIPILFLSTNYVFDGTAPPYHPDDAPNPLNAYGKSKLAGEKAMIGASAENRILRVPMLYGPSDNLSESSVTVILRDFLDTDGPVPLDARQTRYPAYTPDVAAAIVGLLPGLMDGNLPGPRLHFCPEESYTKRDMGAVLAECVGINPGRAAADERPPSGAPRPKDVRLACPHMEALGLIKTTPFREAVKSVLEGIEEKGGLE